MAATWICELIWLEAEQRIIARFTDLDYFAFTFNPNWGVLAATCAVSALAGALFSLAGALAIVARRPEWRVEGMRDRPSVTAAVGA